MFLCGHWNAKGLFNGLGGLREEQGEVSVLWEDLPGRAGGVRGTCVCPGLGQEGFRECSLFHAQGGTDCNPWHERVPITSAHSPAFLQDSSNKEEKKY